MFKFDQKDNLENKKHNIFDSYTIPTTFAEYSQPDAKFHNLFISVRSSTCFRRVFRPSSGAQNCTCSIRYWYDKCLTLYVQFWAPDDGRKNRLKHVERLTEINKLRNVASFWLYSVNILAMHGPMIVKFPLQFKFIFALGGGLEYFNKSDVFLIPKSVSTAKKPQQEKLHSYFIYACNIEAQSCA